jgi:hypothetical protein
VLNQESLLLAVAVVAELELLQPLARVVVSSPLLEKMARDKAVEGVHKLLEGTGDWPTDLELRVQLARYLLVDKVVRAISTVAAVEAVATTVEEVAVRILTAQVMTQEPVAADLLLQILTTHRMSHILLESKAATEWS